MRSKKEVAKLKIEAEAIRGKRTYQPVVDFPQFCSRSERQFRNRIDSVSDFIGNNKRYLDLGCNIGFSAFELAKKGNEVVAVDSDKEQIDFAKVLADYYEMMEDNPKFVHNNILDYLIDVNHGTHFDCAVMFMVFHHLLRPKNQHNGIPYSQTIDIMNLLATKVSYTCITSRDIPSMDLVEVQIPEWIIENTEFNFWKSIDTPVKEDNTPDVVFGYPIWAFWK